MTLYINTAVQRLTSKPRIVFLIDGLGAALTSFLLKVVQATFNEYFQVPTTTLNTLSIIAFFYAIYSFFCFLFFKPRYSWLLALLVSANLIYCVLTLVFVIYYYERITILAVAYFAGELSIILGLVYIEVKTLQVSRRTKVL